jgi:orotate phosphoribosyltransferase
MTELNHARRLAAILLQIKAIRLSPSQPFTWASGLQSPVYCDNRLLLSYPEYRNEAVQGLAALAADYPNADAIAGVATAGIPHGTLLADRMGLPFIYVRSQAKSHGKGNQIEGELRPGNRVLVVEDLISTGGSSLQAVTALREAGLEVLAVLALFSYGFNEAQQRFADAGVPLATVSDYPTIIRIAREEGSVSEEEFEHLQAWYRDPRAWSGRIRPATT